ncbi:DUF4129 domain-containing protein [Mycolicibacterium fallax]|uniref:Uncharacterized protein n=1 Tax=Mycolicibacterium fallax TaxID=1793 RepID=A0A1X1RKB6_MYCFA|nr:DUF4129 domain-containing protein [Mycolicibacterium fallax]ORV08117.1 hypothetical protein AWC04_02390 [Mycolicibacterium fallax]BBY99546.1 hypothetical protein MFAL_30130 [Mycolicibacterium fallax]HOW93715.1 DUF4129 domain-containing protein [Mycolicibacterium fallax]HSA41424.1 DUF4129 domain-containing protein [Mycobacterium sp.]
MADPAVDIGAEQARELARQELADPRYPRATLTDRLNEWLSDVLDRIVMKASDVPGGWLTILVLTVLLVVAVVLTVRLIRRTMHTEDAAAPLYAGAELSAEQHRRRAEDCAARGDWAAAIRHRLRAVARALEESGVLALVPGRTASELAEAASAPFPGLSGEFHSAAAVFNDVTYGERPGDEGGYRLVAGLDDHLLGAPVGGPPGPAPAEGWSAIR